MCLCVSVCLSLSLCLSLSFSLSVSLCPSLFLFLWPSKKLTLTLFHPLLLLLLLLLNSPGTMPCDGATCHRGSWTSLSSHTPGLSTPSWATTDTTWCSPLRRSLTLRSTPSYRASPWIRTKGLRRGLLIFCLQASAKRGLRSTSAGTL